MLAQVCQQPTAARLLPKLLQHPSLLTVPADKITTSATALQDVLQLSEAGLALALRREPAAVLVGKSRVQGLLRVLQTRLGISEQEAQDILLQVTVII